MLRLDRNFELFVSDRECKDVGLCFYYPSISRDECKRKCLSKVQDQTNRQNCPPPFTNKARPNKTVIFPCSYFTWRLDDQHGVHRKTMLNQSGVLSHGNEDTGHCYLHQRCDETSSKWRTNVWKRTYQSSRTNIVRKFDKHQIWVQLKSRSQFRLSPCPDLKSSAKLEFRSKSESSWFPEVTNLAAHKSKWP